MNYEINVSLNGRHFFATHERSITNNWKLKEILTVFLDKFPQAEGYEITVYKEIAYSEHLNIEEIMSSR